VSSGAGESGDAPARNPASPPAGLARWPMLFGATSSVFHQFARYLVVGGLAFVLDFGSLYALTEFAGLYYLVSAAVAFLLGLVANYLLSRTWVFDKRTVDSATVEFTIFAVIGVIGLGLNEGIIWFVREKIHLHYMAAKAMSAAVVLVWNFGARKTILFR